jgi:hypothetical protein
MVVAASTTRDAKVLAALYRRLVRHGITTFPSSDPAKALGQEPTFGCG